MNANILVVDDTPANLRLLMGLLKEQGYTVRPAPSGKHALKVAQNQAIDVILLDILMPEMDGYEVCRRLKAQEATREIPVIFLSALHETFDKVKAFEVGGVDYITKPFETEEVLARVETHLKIRRLYQYLQHKNAQLQEEIAERKRVEEALREANVTKDMFFSIISHDLRAPLGAMLGYANLALTSSEPLTQEDLTDYVEQIKHSAENLSALLENLLTWSRLQRGAMNYHSDHLLLSAMVDDIFFLLHAQADKKQLRLHRHIPETLRIYADENMLNTVLRNLISNALKFTPKGKNITVSAQPCEGKIVISVADTGVGIPKETLPGLFRLDTPTTSPGTAGEIGTGLGLPLCKDLIERQGGTIQVSSIPGQGTTFDVTIPYFPGSFDTTGRDSKSVPGAETRPDDTPPEQPADISRADLPAALARLPESWQEELRHVSESLDLNTALRLIDQIREHDKALADTLSELLHYYQFDVIQEACNNVSLR